MAGWAGFSDEDLMQIKQTTSPGQSRQTVDNATKQQAMARKQKIQQQREMARQRALEFSQGNNAPLPSSQRLSSPRPAQPASKEEAKEQTGTGADTKTAGQSSNAGSVEKMDNDSKEKSEGAGEENESGGSSVKEFNEEEGLRVEMTRIEQFRLQQQKMEEENKQRRRILADAIKQRSKMAKEEAEKLTKVQNELRHLDQLVNADVSIIRDKIEAASLVFLQAQKRYERAEKEFVEAKIALAEKSDLKESLTEHLYTVIQQNEARKAERLAVLMKELGMETEHYPIPMTVPPLLSFSPINTLHRPHVPPTHPSTPASPEGASGEGSQKPCVEHSTKESGEVSQEQGSEQGSSKDSSHDAECSVKDNRPDGAVSNGGKENNTDKDTGAKQQTTGDEGEKGNNVNANSEEGAKTGAGQKVTDKCRENGSPECLDGGANTVA